MSCQDASTRATFSSSDNVWGNGNGTSKETGCVDALYVAQKQHAMLSSWLGRNGANGSGGAWPIRVGLNQQSAYYDGTQVQIGKNTAGRWISSLDVVGHELGHGIDDRTPGGISKGRHEDHVQRDAAEDLQLLVREVPGADAAGGQEPDPGSCTQFNAVKAARNTVSLPAQSGEPTC